MKRHMHLNLFIHSRGHHEASWRHPAASPLSLSDIRYYQALAQQAEAGLFDSIFLADQLALGDDIAHGPRTALEPITVLAALAVSTSRIGLIATASTTYTEPFNLARQFASLDHISRGRIGWNIVTSWLAMAARNYGGTALLSHAERYARAEEFLTVVKGLWDSWADDAELDDRASGRYANPDRIRPLNHEGAYYRVAGPLNLPRCPQGRPVLVQAGSSDKGRGFAARYAEAIFTAQMEKTRAQDFYADLKSRVVAAGRRTDQALILPGLSPLIASSEAEAQRLSEELSELANPEAGRQRLSGRFGGHDFSHLPLDKPLEPEDFPDPSTVEAARSRTEVILDLVRREKPTLRQLLAMTRRCAWALHLRGHAGAGRRSDGGMVQRWRGRWLQHHAARAAGDAGGLHCRSDPVAPTSRAVSHGLRGGNAAGALWFGGTGQPVRLAKKRN